MPQHHPGTYPLHPAGHPLNTGIQVPNPGQPYYPYNLLAPHDNSALPNVIFNPACPPIHSGIFYPPQ